MQGLILRLIGDWNEVWFVSEEWKVYECQIVCDNLQIYLLSTTKLSFLTDTSMPKNPLYYSQPHISLLLDFSDNWQAD